LADLLIEKFIRRQLATLSSEVKNLSEDGDTPLSWLLDKIEQKTLFLTQLRKQEAKGYWNKRDAIVFEQVCKDLEEAERIENIAQRDWVMKKLAKKWKFSSKKELLDFHAKWLDSQNETCTYTAQEYFEKYGNVEQGWLIPGFIAANSVITLYAEGGVGKTRLAFTLAKHAVSGGTFAYEGTDFEPMNTLVIETDQGPLNTSKLLEMHDFLEPSVKDRLRICDKWHFGEFGKLKAMLKKYQPKLVILDSLTSLSVDSIYSENDTSTPVPLCGYGI
jgi:replicative DNA helicase